jgi:cellulose synthase/poly-beta-1,6-N-acetylglucosamine synthase-like glycosyltransferase
MTVMAIVVACVSLALMAHALFSLSLMLYAWERPERLRATAGPTTFREPQLSFSVLLPARGEEAVIADTIARVWSADYPHHLLEIIVICQRDDPRTIDAARRALEELDEPRVRLEIYDEPPFNKPQALTVGYAASRGEVVTVFDAEDDVHRAIFGVINTVMLEERVGIVQGGVQLMNLHDHWFSVFNCLEYFFYFKSKLHFNAKVGMVPLGGNTVFMRRELIDRVGGWDNGCLTEDADIGLRLSALGEPIRVVYDCEWVTREETPHTVRALVKQRTRWHQGFLQVLAKGDWRRIPGWRRRTLALVTFAQPILDGMLLCALPLIPLALLYLKLPVIVALLSFCPLYAVALQALTNIVGVVVFGRAFGERVPWRLVARMPLTYLPYQWLIAFSAVRAIVRHVRGDGEWEKTEHRGAHRRVPAPALAPQQVFVSKTPQVALVEATRMAARPRRAVDGVPSVGTVARQLLVGLASCVVLERGVREWVPRRLVARMPVTYLLSQWLVAFVLRVTVRQLRGDGEWEKTGHRGARRRAPAPGLARREALIPETRQAALEEATT